MSFQSRPVDIKFKGIHLNLIFKEHYADGSDQEHYLQA
jgi:hypothetical protein